MGGDIKGKDPGVGTGQRPEMAAKAWFDYWISMKPEASNLIKYKKTQRRLR